jgi:hypothetical protein
MAIPYKGGFQRSRSVTGDTAQALRAYPIKNGKAKNFYAGDPVTVSNGTLDIAANNGSPVGVALSFQWIDDAARVPVFRSYFPTGTSAAPGYFEGYNQPFALVDDNPKGTWIIAADTTVAVSGLGALARVTAAGTGTVIGQNGRSKARIDTSGTAVSAGNAMVRIVGVYRIGEATSSGATLNTWDATGGIDGTIVEVIFSNHLYG